MVYVVTLYFTMYIQHYLLVEIWEINRAQANILYEILHMSIELI
jgi:hypothetical protein